MIVRNLKLALLFLVCCGLPLWLAWFLIGKNKVPRVPEPVVEDPLAAMVVNASGDFVALEHQAILNPDKETDFAVLAWVWFRKLPDNEDNVVFLAKLDAAEVHKQGYSVGVRRKDNKVRPLVYWRDLAGRGNIFEFAELNLVPRTWLLFVLSLRDEKLLSLHVVPLAEGGPSDLNGESGPGLGFLGAHEVVDQRVPQPSSSLIFGAGQNGLFRGKIGPLAIVKSAEGMGQDFMKKVFTHSSQPELLLKSLNSEVVFFSLDLDEDLSASQVAIERKNKRRKRKAIELSSAIPESPQKPLAQGLKNEKALRNSESKRRQPVELG